MVTLGGDETGQKNALQALNLQIFTHHRKDLSKVWYGKLN